MREFIELALQYIAGNKEWIFSGIGVTLLVGLWVLFRRLVAKRSPHPAPTSDAAPPPAAEPRSPSVHPTPRDIIKQLEALPPFQRPAARTAYLGIPVKWHVTLHSVTPLPNGLAHLMLLDRGSYPWVYCDVSLASYPQVKIAKTGDSLTVSGTIADVEGNAVILATPVLDFT
jgi:hypothetical protein